MELYIKHCLFFILSLLTLNTKKLSGMKRSNPVSFEIYNNQEIKTKAIYYLDAWIVVAIKMIDMELGNWIIEKLANQNNVSTIPNGSLLPSAVVGNYALQSNLFYQAIRWLIESFWENGINNKYKISAVDFIETLQVNYQIDEESLRLIEKKDYYSLKELLAVIVSMLAQDLDLKLSNAEFMNITQKILVIYITQKFLGYGKQLSWCNCPRVLIGERVVMLVMTLEKLLQKFKPHDCIKENPLIYTSLGSGALLYDYIIINLLIHFGYKYIRLNFIDIFYNRTKFPDYKNWTEKPLIFQLGIFACDISFAFFENIDAYLSSFPNINHILTTIDTTHFGNSRSEFKQLIKKTSDMNTIIGLLAEHDIRYEFKAQLKHLCNNLG